MLGVMPGVMPESRCHARGPESTQLLEYREEGEKHQMGAIGKVHRIMENRPGAQNHGE